MPDSWSKSALRGLFRWYLSKFPLRDGKAFLYGRLHAGLKPEDRYAVVRLDKGFRMKLDLADPEQLKVYFYGHYHERYEADLVQRLLADADVFWDVGANVGYFTLVAATALNNRGRIVAFEPGQNAYARLTENLALNPYGNIQTFAVAVSHREGEAVLHLAGDIADSSASLYPANGTQARPGGLPDGVPGPFSQVRGPASPGPHQAGRRGGGTGGAARGPGPPGRLTPPVADGNGRKDPGGRRGQQSRGGPLPHRLRLPGRTSQQRPLVRHRRPGHRQGPQHLLVQPRRCRSPAASGPPAGAG